VATGETCDAAFAACGDTPAAVSPEVSAAGSRLDRPTAISVKKPPIDSTMPAFMPVARMPDAAPRCSAGTAFMIAAVFGAAISPMPMPLSASSRAKVR
jgi:hypothetical protein